MAEPWSIESSVSLPKLVDRQFTLALQADARSENPTSWQPRAAGENAGSSYTDSILRSFDSADQAKRCADNPKYEAFIDTAVSELHDTSKALNLQRFKHAFNCSIKSDEDVLAMAGIAFLSLDDPYSKVLSAKETAAQKKAESGFELGTGAQLFKEGDFPPPNQPLGSSLTVSEVYPHSPADLAGIKPGDKVVELNGKKVAETSLIELSGKVFGDAGKIVQYGIERGGDVTQISVPIAQVSPEKITDKDLGHKITYLKLHDFKSENLAEQMRDTLAAHQDARAFVLDLRNNPGGSYDTAVKIAELFVEHGEISKIEIREPSDPAHPQYTEKDYSVTRDEEIISGTSPERHERKFRNMIGGRPVIVLINGGTYSASEVVAAALQQTGGDDLLGTESGGKGIGQHYKDFDDGTSVHVTDAKLWTPDGKWLGNGYNQTNNRLKPNKPFPGAGVIGLPSDTQLNEAVRLLREKIGT